MAIEEKKVEDNKVVIEQNDDAKQEVTQEAQSNPLVERATALGWMPKEEWIEAGHDEDDWKPAKTFIEVGELIGKVRNQSKELQETKQALVFVSTKNKEVYEKGYKAAITELRTQKRAALAEGDLVKADELEEKIDATKVELEQIKATPAVPKTNAPDPEHLAWLQENPWYNDPIMARFTDSLAIEYIRANNGQVTPADVRDFVTKEVKREFAHKFPQKLKGAPNPDGEGRSTGRQSGSKLDSKLAQAKAAMTDQDRAIMKTMMRSAELTEEAYLKLYVNG